MKLSLILKNRSLSRLAWFIVLLLTQTDCIFAQEENQVDHFRTIDKKLTPSPGVMAMETYGGMELKKNTGGLQKSIPLLTLKEGDLSYTPSIEYFSTGLRVDDWGSNIGMGWAENITAVISRTVRGVPDERASSRIGDTQDAFGPYPPAFTQANLNKVMSMSYPNTTVDGEYDIFSYNIFGKSGSFIVKNGQPLLINDDNSVKITFIDNQRYRFLVTDAAGVKYYFDGQGEVTSFSNENACDIDNPFANSGGVSTAWFLTKIVSPNNHTLNFYYQIQGYNYLYDFTDYWFYSAYHPVPPGSFCFDPPLSGVRTTCLRRKNTGTKLLTAVQGDHFTLVYDYVNRDDIYGGKLLSKVRVVGQEYYHEVLFNYKKVTASSNLEPVIANNIPDQWEQNSIKIRYYLDELKIDDKNYKFNYKDVALVPHRFSLSKDYLGVYNGHANSGLVPRDAMDDLHVT